MQGTTSYKVYGESLGILKHILKQKRLWFTEQLQLIEYIEYITCMQNGVLYYKGFGNKMDIPWKQVLFQFTTELIKENLQERS